MDTLHVLLPSADDENVPNGILDAELWSRLGCLLCTYESLYIIVTLRHCLAIGIFVSKDYPASADARIQEKKATAGPMWFNLPRTDLTPELKRDLQLLRMRSVLDPKRHFKKDNRKSDVPEFSQVGTIIEGPTEFRSARLTNRERKRTLVEEVLAGELSTRRFKSKYNEIQKSKTSGRKDHYKKIKAMRKSKKT